MKTRSTSCLSGTQALILAGGQGQRLFPLTANRSKPAIPFGGIFRIVDFTLSNCLRSEWNHVALLTQYRHEELHSYIRNGWAEVWSRSRHHTSPLKCLPPRGGKRYMGTAHAVFQNLHILDSNRPEHVLILSGDHVYGMDYRALLRQHVETQADVTIAAVEHPLRDASQFGVLEIDNDFKVTGFTEKPQKPSPLPSRPDRALISMGVYLFKADALVESLMENCEQRLGYDFGHDIIPSLIGSACMYAYDFRDPVRKAPRYWRDIGTIDSYYSASMDMVRPDSVFDLQNTLAPANDRLTVSRARLHGNCQVSQTVVSPGVRVEEGARIEDSVLMPGAAIGKGASIRRAIIEEGVRIPPHSRIGWDAEGDRKEYAVSTGGVVVVSTRPRTAEKFVRFKRMAHHAA